jgi:hypothetical protein
MSAFVVVFLAVSGITRAQVIAHPNQIKGTIEFTNVNPAVLAILNESTDSPPGLGYGRRQDGISADSLPPQSPTLHASTSVTCDTRLRTDYELTVESGPPGAGIAYELSVESYLAKPVLGIQSLYRFLPAVSGPVEHEPSPDVSLDIKECAGIIKLVFCDADDNPVGIEGGTATAYPEDPPWSGRFSSKRQTITGFVSGQAEQYVVVRGDGSLYNIEIRVQVGTNEFVDRLTYETETQVRAFCDVVTQVVIRVEDRCDPDFLGSAVGIFDILGEDEHRIDDYDTSSVVKAAYGPWGNYRYAFIDAEPSSGSFLLQNMMPSDVVSPADPYEVAACAFFREGYRFEEFCSPTYELLVSRGQQADLGETFVIDPGRVQGDILLAGPEPVNPAIGSPMEDLYRAEDTDGDGIPHQRSFGSGSLGGSYVMATGSLSIAPGASHSADRGEGSVIFEGAYDPGQAAFRGDYELVLGGLQREPSIWQAARLYLNFRDEATPNVPESYQTCYYDVSPNNVAWLIAPGSTHTYPLHYCMNQVYVHFRAEGGTFIRPWIGGSGTLQGTDFELNPADYGVYYLHAEGTPVSLPGSNTGLVVMTLPQATYDLHPHISALNPSGGTSMVGLNPVTFELGCKQTYEIWADFVLHLDSPPLCTSQPAVTLTGSIEGESSIENIEYTVNGGAPVTYCTSCGTDPPFSIDVTLADGVNDIAITAVDSLGRTALVTTQIEKTNTPPGLGNVLRAVKEDADAHFYFQPAPDSRATELARESVKTFDNPGSIATELVPISEAVDAGAVNAPITLYFYRVRGLNCAGEPGP